MTAEGVATGDLVEADTGALALGAELVDELLGPAPVDPRSTGDLLDLERTVAHEQNRLHEPLEVLASVGELTLLLGSLLRGAFPDEGLGGGDTELLLPEIAEQADRIRVGIGL